MPASSSPAVPPIGCLTLAAAPPAVHDEVLRHVAALSCSNGFPGGNPVSIERQHFPRLRAEPYMVCEKTDGTRAMLACVTCRVDGEDLLVVALFTRKMDIVYLPRFGSVNRAAFQGTLLDVEVVRNVSAAADGRCVDLLVFDAVCVCGVPVAEQTLQDRLLAADLCIRAWPQLVEDDARLVVKRFYGSDAELAAAPSPSPYATDGLILTPSMQPNTYGRNYRLFKWKPADRHTIDFLVGEDRRTLLVFDSSSREHGRHRVAGRLDRDTFPGAIVECAPGSGGEWTPLMVRRDKGRANDSTTFERTLVNIRECISREEVLAFFT